MALCIYIRLMYKCFLTIILLGILKHADDGKDIMKISLIRKFFSYEGVQQDIVEDALLNLLYLFFRKCIRIKGIKGKFYWNGYAILNVSK